MKMNYSINAGNITFGTIRVKTSINKKDSNSEDFFNHLKKAFPSDVSIIKSKNQFRDGFHRFDISGSDKSEAELFSALKLIGFEAEKVNDNEWLDLKA